MRSVGDTQRDTAQSGPTIVSGNYRAWSMGFVLVRTSIEIANKDCARRGSWGSVYGQEFDSPHLHHEMIHTEDLVSCSDTKSSVFFALYTNFYESQQNMV